MGIEPTRTALPELGNKRFGAMADPRCDGGVIFRGMWGHVALRRDTWMVESPGLRPTTCRSLTGQHRAAQMPLSMSHAVEPRLHRALPLHCSGDVVVPSSVSTFPPADWKCDCCEIFAIYDATGASFPPAREPAVDRVSISYATPISAAIVQPASRMAATSSNQSKQERSR
jgi:hypothetical protein